MVKDDIKANDLAFIDDELAKDVLTNDAALRLFEEFLRRIRSEFFASKASSDSATIDPQVPIGEVVEALARAHFTPNWLLSYRYRGEVANLVRFEYKPEQNPQYPFRQLHVRLFEDGTLEAHDEPSALMHKSAHVKELTFSRKRGTTRVARVLEKYGVPFERLD